MREAAEELLKERIQPGMKVLDVGGGGGTSRFATHVIDQMPYEIWKREWREGNIAILEKNWVVRDVCSREPWPFVDKYFDFVICSHILEDIRDPVWVCEEMSRIGKAGYVEVPSVLLELTRGMNPGRRGGKWVGFLHHRWLVWEENGTVQFRYKPHFLHCSRRFHFPPRYAQKWVREGKAYTYLFWDGSCPAREVLRVFQVDTEKDIEAIVLGAGGKNMAIRWHEMENRLWNVGKKWSQKMGMHESLRLLVSRLAKRL
jgi:ubiquinone/menaquinone biosynthesis C-methylase UbiE